MKLVTASTILALVVPTASTALADESALDAEIETPTFATLDRTDARSHADVGMSMAFFDGQDPDFNTRLDLYGQYVTPTGAGGYASLPISYLSDNDESETALGNLELGGIYNIDRGSTQIVLRGGLALATADESFEGVITNLVAVQARLTDLVGISPNTTWMRVAGSPIHRSGNLFVRGDFGFDVAIDEPSGADVDPIVRANLGVGFVDDTFALMGELVTIGTTGDVSDGEDRFLHTAALSVRLDTGTVSPYAALIMPLDEVLVDVSFVATAGLQIPLAP